MENQERAKLAGACNFLAWGTGYLYLGQRTYAALGLVAAWLLAMAWAVPRWMAGDPAGLADAAIALVGAALGWDAYAGNTTRDADASTEEPAAN